jgi:hypothetical protein
VSRRFDPPPEGGVLGGMLLQHAFGKLRSSRAATLRRMEQERKKQGGFGSVVLVGGPPEPQQ